MTKIIDLSNLAHQFITERNWWQFHNPKSDAMNIMVEVGELAECFIANDQSESSRTKIAEEMSDVLFGSFCFALLTNVDIANAIGLIAGDFTLKDSDANYEQLQDLVLKNLEKFNVNNLTMPQQVVLSLTVQASQLADIFVWCRPEQSITRAQEQHSFVALHSAHIVTHLMYLALLVDSNLPIEYRRKVQKNGSKYPVKNSSGADYIEIKDRSRGRKNGE